MRDYGVDAIGQEQRIRQAAEGDRQALEHLLMSHYNMLVRYIAAGLPPSVQAAVSVEDILQDTFSLAFRDIGKLAPRGERAFAAWLKTIAENRLRDAIKELKRKKRGGGHLPVRTQAGTSTGSFVDLVELLSAGDRTPSRILAGKEAVQAVQVSLAALPDDYREVIRLRYLEGKGTDEIASEMNRSPGAIRGLVDRAKKMMREALGRSSKYLSSR
jgi:RNA polymerase sigma-70 factor, ECF subfamily